MSLMSFLDYKCKVQPFDMLGVHTPAAQLDQEVQGILWHLHLLSGRTDLVGLWDRAHHLHPKEVTINRHRG